MVRQRRLRPLGLERQPAKIGPGIGEVGPHRQHSSMLDPCLLRALQGLQRSHPDVEAAEIVRRQRKHPRADTQRLLRPPESEQGIASPGLARHIGPIDRQRLVVAPERLRQAAELAQHVGVVGEDDRRPRVDRQRLADQALGLGEASALPLEHTEELQGIEVAGQAGKDTAIQGGRLRQLTRLMLLDRVLKRLREGRLSGRSLHIPTRARCSAG